LAYEYEQYSEASQGLPRRGKEVVSPYGKGRVVEIRTLAGEIIVDVDGVRNTVLREDIGKTEFTNPPEEPAPRELPSWLSSEPVTTEKASEKASQPASSQKTEQGSKRSRRRRRSRRKPEAKASTSQSQKTGEKPAESKPARKKKSSRRRRRPRSKGQRDSQK
jgi:hypothetical protein